MGQSGTLDRLPGQKTDGQYWFFHSTQDGRQRPLEKVTLITHRVIERNLTDRRQVLKGLLPFCLWLTFAL